MPLQKPVIPLSLEDSCLAWLVSDLEHYPPELLALLPLKLRHRLLANVPVLDLCQLEHTSVAEGIDVESIWELKCSPWGEEGAAVKHRPGGLVDYIDLSSLSWRDHYLHSVANTILNNSLVHVYHRRFSSQGIRSYFYAHFYTVVIDWLISLRGYQFLNEGGDLQSSYDWQNLASSFFFFEVEGGNRYDRLTPSRYVPYKSGYTTRPSDEELITLLLRKCHFKPKCLLVQNQSVRHTVSKLLLQCEACDVLKEFLNEVRDVQLYAPDKLPNLPVVLSQSLFSGTSSCQLRTLQVHFCHTHSGGLSEHDREEFQKYMIQFVTDVIKQQYSLEIISLGFSGQFKDTVLASGEFAALATALTSFAARPQFRTLDIHEFPAPVDVVTDILSAFLVSPCSHQQTLKLPTQPSSRQLHPATTFSAGRIPVSDSCVEYKELYLHQQVPMRVHVVHRQPLANKLNIQLCKTFFAFPKIRLRFLEVGCFQTTAYHCINTIHMAAQHPDIRVKTLSIRLRCRIEEVLPTLHDDMRALLQIPTLTNLSLRPMTSHAYGIASNIFLPILAQELPKRHHLAAIEELDLGRSNFLELPAEEVEHLFQSIFSLPHLSQLTLRMNYCVMSFHHYKLIHRLWTEYSSGERLKKLVLGNVVVGEKVSGVMTLLDSMAQNTSVVECYGWEILSGVDNDLIKFKTELRPSDFVSEFGNL